MSGWAVYEDQIKTTCSANAGGGIFSLDDYKPWCQYGVSGLFCFLIEYMSLSLIGSRY